MALADIINRIASDGSAESEGELAAATARAEQIIADARTQAESHHEHALEMARRDSASAAATIVASARLATRDQALAAKRELIAETLTRVVEVIEALPADRYARFLAQGITNSARPGDVVAFAAADRGIADAVRGVVESAADGQPMQWSDDPAPITRGVLVTGPRTTVEITPASIVAERRDELEAMVATELFPREER